jgi:hypothetical protein
MKKICLLILLVASCSLAKAQFTLTSASNPVLGDVDQSWTIDTLNLGTGSSGTSQIWNFTGISITPSMTIKSNSYVATSAAPNNSLFPSANLASTSDGSTYSMFAYTNTNIVVYGFTSNTLTAVYQDPLTFVTLPFSYGMISTDTYSSSFSYSGTPIAENGTVTTTADGYGTLNTPGNSYPNVLRIKLQNYLIQNIGAVGSNTTNSIDYIFLGATSKFALLSVNNSTTSTSTSTVISKTKSGKVSNSVLQGIKELHNSTYFSIYPNPAGKEVTLSLNLTNSENYSGNIFNTLGQKVKEIQIGERAPGIYFEKVDLTALQSGIYYIKLKGKNSEGVQKLIIE